MKPTAFPDQRDEVAPEPAGRNQPCLCGSGRKYKNCCQPLQRERKRWEPLEDKVRALIEEFVHDERFEEELERASSLFGFDREGADLAEQRLFYDWCIHDYVIPGEGKSLVMLLEERTMAKQVSDEGIRSTLGSWASSTFSFLEVLEVRRGTGFRVKDIFRGSEYFVWDVSGSYSLSRYDVLFSRPYPVGRIVRIASGTILLPQKLKSRVEEYVETGYQDFVVLNKNGTMDDYLRSRSLSIMKYLRTAFAKEPTVVTLEGDMLLFSSCDYTLSDPGLAVKLLDSCEELVDVGEEEDGALRYDWVKKADEKEGGEKEGGGDTKPIHDEPLRLQTYLSNEEGGEQLMVLGNISLKGNKLEVSCASDSRLQSCKALVERLLGRLVVERSEDRYVEPYSTLEGGGEREEREKDEDEIPPEVQSKIAEKFFDEYYARWLHTKLPALENMTPLEASRTAEGRRKLEETLKVAENEAERSGGKLKLPIAKLRAALGL